METRCQLNRGKIPSSLAEAFAQYSRERRRHLQYNQLASRWLTPFFQFDSKLAAYARDWSFPMLNKVPPLYRQALRTIAGVKTGLLFDKPLLDLSAPSINPFSKPVNVEKNILKDST